MGHQVGLQGPALLCSHRDQLVQRRRRELPDDLPLSVSSGCVHRRRLADLAVATALSGMAIPIMKMIIGRPKPRPTMAEIYDAGAFLGPLGAAPLGPEVGVRHAWEFWAPGVSLLQSMPSAHAASAAILSVFLYTLYPRLKVLLITMVVIVCVCRVLFIAHWASDVVIGTGVGVAIAQIVLAQGSKRGGWGCRYLDARQRSA